MPVPVTVAANCTPCPAGTVAVGGFTETVTGSSVIVVAALLVVSAALTAVTVTVCWVGTRVGAVYTPVLETLPIPLGAALHATCKLLVPVTVGVMVRLCPAVKTALCGLTEMLTGPEALPMYAKAPMSKAAPVRRGFPAKSVAMAGGVLTSEAGKSAAAMPGDPWRRL